MSAPTVITCPSCKKQFRIPPEALGRKVRCKCGATMRAPAPAAEKPAAPAKKSAAPAKAAKPPAASPVDEEAASYTFMSESGETTAAVSQPDAEANDLTTPPRKFLVDEGDENPYVITELDDTARCPFCAKEMESAEAIICLNCGYNTQSRRIAQTRRVHAITFWDWCKWLSPGIACVLVILAVLAFDLWFCFGKRKDWWDPMDEDWGVSFSRGFRVWVSVMALGLMWVAAKFAFRRLVLNPKPPEIEKKK
jgi:hypothetical protein